MLVVKIWPRAEMKLMRVDEKAQPEGSIQDGVRVHGSASTDHRCSRSVSVNERGFAYCFSMLEPPQGNGNGWTSTRKRRSFYPCFFSKDVFALDYILEYIFLPNLINDFENIRYVILKDEQFTLEDSKGVIQSGLRVLGPSLPYPRENDNAVATARSLSTKCCWK